jgi:hypothetical protein
MDSGRAQLTIRRDSQADIRQREVIMSLDGERIGRMLFGQRLTREVSPGSHQLRAYNTLFWKTVEFNAEPGDHIEFLVTNYAKRGFPVIATFFGFAPLYVKLEQTNRERSPEPRQGSQV